MLAQTHEATIYNALGEDAEGRAQWRRTVLSGVRVEARRGANRANSGDATTDAIRAFIPAGVEANVAYIDPADFGEGAGWTLREGDYLALGSRLALDPREAERAGLCYRITAVDPKSLVGLHHWEVAGV